jgi:thioredoxin reductase (NADPH)
MSVYDLIIVGAGPSGLSAAIAAKRRGLDYLIVEQGVLVNSIFHFPPQMVFFTTPELLEIGGLPFVSPYEKPTRDEALRYYRRVADSYELQIALGERVVSVRRLQSDEASASCAPFAVETRSAASDPGEGPGREGVACIRHSRNVLMAIGYYDHPNLLNVPGEDLPHVHHYYCEPHPFYRQRVAVVGGGNSAAECALDLYRSGAHVTLVHYRSELKATIKYWVRPDIENRIREGVIAARFSTRVSGIRPGLVMVVGPGGPEELPADAVFLLSGYHPDRDLLARSGVHLSDAMVPSYDPNTFETNVPGLFLAGGALAGGEIGNIFIENGRFHGEKIVEVIAAREQGE